MQENQKPSLKRTALSFLGVIALVVIVAIVYRRVDRTTALIVGGILAAILFIADRWLKYIATKTTSAITVKATQVKPPSQPETPVYSDKEIKELVSGLWATQDPTEPDYRDGIMRAGYYRRSCAEKLRKLGKAIIPYLEPYADREEVAPLLAELKKQV